MARMVRLPNGVEMPALGLGTYKMSEADLARAVPAALDAGYRLFDTATGYRTEQALGRILGEELARRGLSRSAVFITTKLRPADHGYEQCRAAIARSAAHFGGVIDLFLIHWPGALGLAPGDGRNGPLRAASWRALQEALLSSPPGGDYDGPGPSPRVRAIGVSNYTVGHLEEMQRMAQEGRITVLPMVNQYEMHPLYHPQDLVSFCARHAIHIQAYSPFACGRLLAPSFLEAFPRVLEIARRMRGGEPSSPGGSDDGGDGGRDGGGDGGRDGGREGLAAVYLQWALQQGFSVIPKSSSVERIRENAAPFVGEGAPPILTAEEMAFLDGVEGSAPHKECWDPTCVA